MLAVKCTLLNLNVSRDNYSLYSCIVSSYLWCQHNAAYYFFLFFWVIFFDLFYEFASSIPATISNVLNIRSERRFVSCFSVVPDRLTCRQSVKKSGTAARHFWAAVNSPPLPSAVYCSWIRWELWVFVNRYQVSRVKFCATTLTCSFVPILMTSANDGFVDLSESGPFEVCARGLCMFV